MTLLTGKQVDLFNNSLVSPNETIKWAWSCRVLDNARYKLDTSTLTKPRVGDLALVQVKEIGKHTSMVMIDNKKMRIYENDLLVGVFGNRYATDAFEGIVDDVNDLSILTAAGMIGTFKSKHSEVGRPTSVSFIGFLSDEKGKRTNLRELKFNKSLPRTPIKNLLVVVGSGMNSGKTTASSKLIKGLSKKGLKISACKLTGSVSNRDQDEMRSASAKSIIDFSDYGFPSTYLCSKEDLMDLFNTMLTDMENINPDIIVMEIADGILQRETAMILADQSIKKLIKAVILTAESATSALYATEHLQKLGYKVIAVSGTITSSPLSVREFSEHSKIPVASSADCGDELVDIVAEFIKPTAVTIS